MKVIRRYLIKKKRKFKIFVIFEKVKKNIGSVWSVLEKEMVKFVNFIEIYLLNRLNLIC